MTDRFNALLVILDKDIREDDAQCLIQAIEQFRNVRKVTGNIANIQQSISQARVRGELINGILKILKDD